MKNQSIKKRLTGISATLALAGTGLAVTAQAASAGTGVVDVNGLLRLLDFYDLNPLF